MRSPTPAIAVEEPAAAPAGVSPKEMEEALRAEGLALVYGNSGFILGGAVLASVFFAGVLMSVAHAHDTAAWLAAILLVTAQRWRWSLAYRAAPPVRRADSVWVDRFVLGAAASGIVWGVGCVLLSGHGAGQLLGFPAFVIGGLCAAAVSGYAPIHRAVVAFVVPALGLLTVGFLLTGESLSLVMAPLVLVFLALMLRLSLRQCAMFRREIALRLANRDLVADLTASADTLRRANRDLEREVAERKATEQQLRLAGEVFDGSIEGIMITDSDGRILSVNRAFTRITGYCAAEAVGRTPRLLRSGMHGEDFYRAMREALASAGVWRGEIWDRRKSGENFPTHFAISAVRDLRRRITHYVAVFSDISERKAAEERIEFLAHHDALTGLPNRVLLRDRFEHAAAQAARRERRLALLVLDIDNFKGINDSLGHTVGDELLRGVAARLRDCLRGSDTVARASGDEFLVLLDEFTDAGAIPAVVGKIQAALRPPIEVSGSALAFTCSIGASRFPEDGDGFDVLLQKADTAVHEAKRAGRNTWRAFQAAMNVDALEHVHLHALLRKALERGEFALHYQPQVDLADGRVIGVEALLRWVSADVGAVSPAKFIPVAEETGLIVPIGAWVMQEACRQNRAWQDAGLPRITMAVNISALQMAREEFVDSVEEALRDARLDPGCLELELTESILVRDAEHALKVARRLKERGLTLSIDDFGTGYSSLAYLKRFAVDKLKIDQSFVRDLTTDADDAAIVRAVIQMGRSLGLTTIAEGVETEAQARYLRQEGCAQAQGYHFARPLPAAEVEALLRAATQARPAAPSSAPRTPQAALVQ
jgi:diguanylate cyclase (GGDEF)-like protein/PAS domain S-box-containing protein